MALPFCRRKLFNEHHEDPSYMPLPEERPGGFNWGEGAAQPPAAGVVGGGAGAAAAAAPNANNEAQPQQPPQ